MIIRPSEHILILTPVTLSLILILLLLLMKYRQSTPPAAAAAAGRYEEFVDIDQTPEEVELIQMKTEES